MRFRTTLRLAGKTTTGIAVPAEVVDGLGGSQRPSVRVTINGGYSYRSTVSRRGEEFLLPVNGDVRKAAGIAAGDELDIDLELDTAPREVTVPADLAAAMNGDTDATRFFDGLSYSQKSGFVSWIESAKKPETRQKRVDDAVVMLREGRTR